MPAWAGPCVTDITLLELTNAPLSGYQPLGPRGPDGEIRRLLAAPSTETTSQPLRRNFDWKWQLWWRTWLTPVLLPVHIRHRRLSFFYTKPKWRRHGKGVTYCHKLGVIIRHVIAEGHITYLLFYTHARSCMCVFGKTNREMQTKYWYWCE